LSKRGLSQSRRRDILSAATKVFMRDGYAATSIDQVAELAGVSKPTIYKHFESKQNLFAAIWRQFADEALGAEDLAHLKDLPPRQALEAYGRHIIALAHRPEVVSMYRMIIGESRLFPEVITILTEAACTPCLAMLQDCLTHLKATGQLQIEDVELATNQFFILLEQPLYWYILQRRDKLPDQAEQEHLLKHATGMFLSYYQASA